MSLMYPCSTSKYLLDVSVKKIEDDPLTGMNTVIMQMVKMLGKGSEHEHVHVMDDIIQIPSSKHGSKIIQPYKVGLMVILGHLS